MVPQLFKVVAEVLTVYRGPALLACAGAAIAASLKAYDNYGDRGFLEDNIKFEPDAYSSFTFLLGLLIAFRTNQAYERFWEGCALLHRMMGNWYNAASSLVAFCRYSDADPLVVQELQHVLIRLSSLICALILGELAGDEEDEQSIRYEVIDLHGLDRETLKSIATCSCKPEMIFQKIQSLLVEAVKTGVLNVPPPILTRSFQELSNAMLNFHEASKLVTVPFPVRYIVAAQILATLHFLMTPIVVISWTATSAWAALFSFIQIFMMTSLMKLARGLDNPFQAVLSDLDVKGIQKLFNARLKCLLREAETAVPTLTPHARTVLRQPSHVHVQSTQTSFAAVMRGAGGPGNPEPCAVRFSKLLRDDRGNQDRNERLEAKLEAGNGVVLVGHHQKVMRTTT